MADITWIEYGYYWDKNDVYRFGEIVHEYFKAESYTIINKLYEIVGDVLWNSIYSYKDGENNIMEITVHYPTGDFREVFVKIKEID